jgi:hypothetical protein
MRAAQATDIATNKVREDFDNDVAEAIIIDREMYTGWTRLGGALEERTTPASARHR